MIDLILEHIGMSCGNLQFFDIFKDLVEVVRSSDCLVLSAFHLFDEWHGYFCHDLLDVVHFDEFSVLLLHRA